MWIKLGIIFFVIFLLIVFLRYRHRNKQATWKRRSLKEPLIDGFEKIVVKKLEKKEPDPWVNDNLTDDTVSNLNCVDLTEGEPGFKEKTDSVTSTQISDSSTMENGSNKKVIPPLVILFVMAPTNQTYGGYDLLQALLASGLRYGKKNIFHRYERRGEEKDGEEILLFSLASANDPGIFDLSKMGTYRCPGLCLFITLTNHDNLKTSLFAWEAMLKTAKQLSEELGGDMVNQQRHLINEAVMLDARKQIVAFHKNKKLVSTEDF